MLKLPKGEVSILSEREVSDTEKLVTVEVGKRIYDAAVAEVLQDYQEFLDSA